MKRVQLIILSVCISVFCLITNGFASSYDLRQQGIQNAPVLLYVFSSPSCSHCAVFHHNVLPVLQKQFINTQQAHLIYVDMPATAKDLYATMIGRCLDKRFYQTYMQMIFQQQRSWIYSRDFEQQLLDYAHQVGADINTVKTCLNDDFLINKIIGQRDNLSTLYRVRALPSIVVVKQGETHLIKGTDTQAITEQIKTIVEQK